MLFYMASLRNKSRNSKEGLENHAARLVTDTRKYDHITPVLIELHWLPVEQRIVFKIQLLSYDCLHGLAASYLIDLIVKKKAFSAPSFVLTINLSL